VALPVPLLLQAKQKAIHTGINPIFLIKFIIGAGVIFCLSLLLLLL
jgi:hypothetical protein